MLFLHVEIFVIVEKIENKWYYYIINIIHFLWIILHNIRSNKFNKPGVVSMYSGVSSLNEINNIKMNIFGKKASNLSRMINLGIPILPGFCITLNSKEDYYCQIGLLKNQIKEYYDTLIRRSGANSVIVRSSAEVEDSYEALFPGLFESFSNITSIEKLFSAIENCYNSMRNPRVIQYACIKNIGVDIKFFSIIVQAELIPDYSGVAFSQPPFSRLSQSGIMIAQITCGNNHDLVKGIGKSNTYSFRFDNTFIFRDLHKEISIDKRTERKILKKLFDLITIIKADFRHEVDVEWGYKNNKIYIFQARNLSICSSENKEKITTLSSDNSQGLKYQSMLFFCKNGLFSREALFFPKQTENQSIFDGLNLMPNNTRLTIRYSKGNEIGLPRYFSKSKTDAIRFIKKTRNPEWSVIIYKSLDVIESFEIYIDKEKTILEHKPGVWESDSKQSADTIISFMNQTYFWLAKGDRQAKICKASGVYYKKTSPLDSETVVKSFQIRKPTFDFLKKCFYKDLPINIHFVSDGKHDYYINCRTTSSIKWKETESSDLFRIKSIADCGLWDGKSDILFCPELHRGEEILITEYVPFLKLVSVPIFVEFGLLSHPAIMLREFGINVLPYFWYHKHFGCSNELI